MADTKPKRWRTRSFRWRSLRHEITAIVNTLETIYKGLPKNKLINKNQEYTLKQ
ncbi:hypothetical protein [Nostoc commune]|uniref:hypothetical protein n=1 Tax=Nostoc commune TaxID=1178 RepID=UPI0015E8047E|nr:hypothetical protein [Nostoc commune]